MAATIALLAGFEPTTVTLTGYCNYQLCYRRSKQQSFRMPTKVLVAVAREGIEPSMPKRQFYRLPATPVATRIDTGIITSKLPGVLGWFGKRDCLPLRAITLVSVQYQIYSLCRILLSPTWKLYGMITASVSSSPMLTGLALHGSDNFLLRTIRSFGV